MKACGFLTKYKNRIYEVLFYLLVCVMEIVSFFVIGIATARLVDFSIVLWYLSFGMMAVGYFIKKRVSRTEKPARMWIRMLVGIHVVSLVLRLIYFLTSYGIKGIMDEPEDWLGFFSVQMQFHFFFIGIMIWDRIARWMTEKRDQISQRQRLFRSGIMMVLVMLCLFVFVFPMVYFKKSGGIYDEFLIHIIIMWGTSFVVGIMVSCYDSIKKHLLPLWIGLLAIGVTLYGVCRGFITQSGVLLCCGMLCCWLIFSSSGFLCIELITFLVERIQKRKAHKQDQGHEVA